MAKRSSPSGSGERPSLNPIVGMAVASAILLGGVVLRVSAQATGDEGGQVNVEDDPIEDRFSADMLAEWVEIADETAEIRIRLPEEWPSRPWNARLYLSAHLGPLSYEWTQGPYRVEPGDEVQIPVEIPEGAWLDDLSASYVTTLRVHAAVGGIHGVMPEAVIAWPAGYEAGPVVWTAIRGATLAPYGVLDAALVAFSEEAGIDPAERLQPPIDTTATRRALDTGEPDEADGAASEEEAGGAASEED